MPVMIYRSISTRVQDFVNAWLTVNNPKLFMVSPITKLVITDHLVDMPIIGFSTKLHRDHFTGFPEKEPTPETAEGVRVFDIEAVLRLEFERNDLPKELLKIENDFWIFEVTDDSLVAAIKLLADAIFEIFEIDIVIIVNQVHDADPKHRAEQPVDARFPSGVTYCPLVPKKI